MTISSLLRSATLALSLVAATGVMTASAFAATDSAAQSQQQQAQQQNFGPYDNQDFNIPENNIQP